MTVYEKTSSKEFRSAVLKFINYMGQAGLSEEQRHGLYRALTLRFLTVDDPSGKTAQLFHDTSMEYCKRMSLLGLNI